MDVNISGVQASYDYSFAGEIKFTDVGTTVVTAPADADSFYYLGSIEPLLPALPA